MAKIVNNTTFVGLFDLIAPHSCRGCGALGSVLCECCKKNIIAAHRDICPKCKGLIKGKGLKCKKCKGLPQCFVIGERQGLLGDIVHSYKYDSIRALARPLAEIMDELMPSLDGDVAIVPLPTIGRHVRERGLDHTYLVAKHFAKRRGYRMERVIVRARNSVQVGADSATRKRQASLAYVVPENAGIESEVTYLLFDDVWTTGASMLAAVKKLQEAGAKKIMIVLLSLSRN